MMELSCKGNIVLMEMIINDLMLKVLNQTVSILANTKREFEIVPTAKEHQEKPVKSKYHCFPSK